jgi:hypothetical protein
MALSGRPGSPNERTQDMPNRRTSSCLVAVLSATAALGAAAEASAAKLQMPFKCGTTVYGQARADHDPRPAIDFNGTGGGDTDLGMPVVAAAAGRVTVSTYYTSNGYGNAVELGHGKGQRTFYAHLRDRRVRAGQRVRRGQLIGHVGKSSAKYSFTAHLHYEQRRNGRVVQARFNGAPAPVYRRMEQSVSMTSRNCGGRRAAPKPDRPGNDGTSRRRGVELPGISHRRVATIQTDNGLAVSARRAPRTSAKEVLEYRNGDRVRIVCQRRGERVTGKFGTSRLWSLVDIGNGRGAWVTDTYVFTGSDGRVAPRCPR